MTPPKWSAVCYMCINMPVPQAACVEAAACPRDEGCHRDFNQPPTPPWLAQPLILPLTNKIRTALYTFRARVRHALTSINLCDRPRLQIKPGALNRDAKEYDWHYVYKVTGTGPGQKREPIRKFKKRVSPSPSPFTPPNHCSMHDPPPYARPLSVPHTGGR